MKKNIAVIISLLMLLSCNDGNKMKDHSNYNDTINHPVDSGGIKKDPNMNNMNNMTDDSGFRQGGSHTN